MISTVITKTTGRNKVIDLRDGLVAAHEEDYANLHGAGGRKGKAPVSVIKVYICDYSAGTGEASRTLHASISPELCEQLLEICKQNIGVQVVEPNLAPLVEQRTVNQKLSKGADMNFGILNSGLKILERLVKADEAGETVKPSALISGAKTLLTKNRAKAMEESAPAPMAPFQIPRHMDFSYAQDRVHAFGTVKEGDMVPVQRLNIFHQTFRSDGQASNYPWTVKITNAKAPVHFQATGATTFSSSGMTDKQEAFIQISDADMYRMMSRVYHYISVWEHTVAAKVVAGGLQTRENEWRASQEATKGNPSQEEN